MHLCDQSCLSSQLAGWAGAGTVLCGKNVKVGHYIQTFQQCVFIPAMLIGTIDLHHFMLPSVNRFGSKLVR